MHQHLVALNRSRSAQPSGVEFLTTTIKPTLSFAAALALICAACGNGSANAGNTVPGTDPVPDQPGVSDVMVPIVQKVPWVNAAVPQVDATGTLITAPLPYYPPLATPIEADLGKNLLNQPVLPNGDDSIVTTAPIDCTNYNNYDFAAWTATSEPAEVAREAGTTDATGLAGIAVRWAGADDYTRGSWRVPGFTTWYPALIPALSPIVWGTPAEQVPDGTIVPTCDNQPNQWVIHMRGAGFRYYGGNIAHILSGDNYASSNYCPPGSDLCPPVTPMGATTDSAGFPVNGTKNSTGDGYQLRALHTYWDASKYEGISFWARRGKDSMGTLMITLAEKHTSDDMNRQNETFCRRIYQCRSTCQNYQQCLMSTIPTDTTALGGPVYRCFDPNIGLPGSVPTSTAQASDDELDAIAPRCGQSACTFRLTYPDADFEGKACTPYTFTSGESNEYCFNGDGHDALGNATPVDPPPPSRFERCGDGFTDMVQLTEDWVFYTIPFSEMRQGGYGKVSEDGLDLKSVYSITLGWGPGNVDFFLDNVSFYRTKTL